MDAAYVTISSTVSLEHIPHLWAQNDILILIIDMDDYDTVSIDYLDDTEKKHLKGLQTKYFKKRYTISRMILKYILRHLLKERSVSDIVLYKKNGKVYVRNHNDIHICISYTENIATLTISKFEIGVDIELMILRSLTNISKYLRTTPADRSMNDLDLLGLWALNEAYCKFSNKSIFYNFSTELDLNSVCHSIYIINNKYILAIITDSDQHTINISHLKKIG
jgi:4'-phosphopantetheinyl transferase